MNEADGDRICDLHDRLEQAINALCLRGDYASRYRLKNAWGAWYRRSRFHADASM